MTFEEYHPDMSPAEVLGKPDMILDMDNTTGTTNFWHLSDGGMVMQDWDSSGKPYENTLTIFSKEEVEKIHQFTRGPS